MHYTGKICKKKSWMTSYSYILSHLPNFKLCKPGKLVAQVHLCAYNANIDIHEYPEVTLKSFILDRKFKISSFGTTKVNNVTSQTKNKL